MASALNWFEIPVADMDRAVKFYTTILDTELTPTAAMPGLSMAMFPVTRGNIGGAIVQGEGYIPSAEGTIVYLNGGDDLGAVLARVEAAGGKLVVPKTDIGQHGFIALFMDSEGNKVGLHSMG